jgi:hypothetical protein
VAKSCLEYQTYCKRGYKQVLAALTAGILPNGIGEYAGKALYYEKSETTQVIF